MFSMKIIDQGYNIRSFAETRFNWKQNINTTFEILTAYFIILWIHLANIWLIEIGRIWMIGIRMNILDGSGLTGSTQMWLDVAQKYLPSKSIDRLYLIDCFPFINGVWRQKMFSWVYFCNNHCHYFVYRILQPTIIIVIKIILNYFWW